MPRPLYIFVSLLLLASSTGCRIGHHTPDKPQNTVVILYDNDVHCAVEGYAAMAALQDKMSASTPYVEQFHAEILHRGILLEPLPRVRQLLRL